MRLFVAYSLGRKKNMELYEFGTVWKFLKKLIQLLCNAASPLGDVDLEGLSRGL